MSAPAALERVRATPERLQVTWCDGSSSEFASIWLRDNRASDRDAVSGQRLTDVTDLPAAPRIATAVLEAGAVRITFEGEAQEVAFAPEFLAAHACPGAAPPAAELRQTWLEGAALDARADFAWATLTELSAHAPLRLQWLTRLLRQGVAFIADVPASENAILEAVPLAGQVLATNYGLTFDVRTVAQPENLAYSDLGLGLHTDNPYREPVPGFQALHVVTAARDGGESLFADGFALAEHLRAAAPEAFALLTRTPVPFHYRSRDAELHALRPLIQLSAGGEVSAVHYNSRSIAPIALPAGEATAFYDAYRRFAQLLRTARFQLRTHLFQGTLVLFDNQRILHGRTAFASSRYPRHLRGCYLTRDSVRSTAALLRRQLTVT